MFLNNLATLRVGIFFFFLIAWNGSILFAHENHSRSFSISSEKLKQINKDYFKTIKPIFGKKCLDCHGKPIYPWYYKIPWAKKIIDRDIQEAKKHLDILEGFPFKGHGNPVEDLKAIQKSIENGSMPPLRYWIMHWDKRITSKEKKEILEWIQKSILSLKEE